MKGSYEITNLTALKMRLSCARKTNQNLDENVSFKNKLSKFEIQTNFNDRRDHLPVDAV